MKKDEVMKLSDAKPGMELEVYKLPDDSVKAHFVRLGVTEGVKIKCAYKLPGGTVVISKQHQEIAVGSEIAKKNYCQKNLISLCMYINPQK